MLSESQGRQAFRRGHVHRDANPEGVVDWRQWMGTAPGPGVTRTKFTFCWLQRRPAMELVMVIEPGPIPAEWARQGRKHRPRTGGAPGCSKSPRIGHSSLQLLQDVGDVHLDSAFTNIQGHTDLLVAFARRHRLHDFRRRSSDRAGGTCDAA